MRQLKGLASAVKTALEVYWISNLDNNVPNNESVFANTYQRRIYALEVGARRFSSAYLRDLQDPSLYFSGC